MQLLRLAFAILLLLAVPLQGQEKHGSQTTPEQTKDVDPLAMDVLRAVTQPIQQAPSFTFAKIASC